MSFTQLMFYIGCAVAWLVLLPLCIVGGVVTLLGYAVFFEVREMLSGGAKTDVDSSTARELARRVCLGN